MKTLHSTRIFLALVAMITLLSAKTFAAVNAYLYFDDGKGKITKVSVASDGSFKSPVLAQGTYTVRFGIGRGISSPTGGSVDRESSAPSVSEVVFSGEITAPRDASSGLPTGKRMHKPITITKEVDKTSPVTISSGADNPMESLSVSFGKIIVDSSNNGISGSIVLKGKDGKSMAMDSWQK